MPHLQYRAHQQHIEHCHDGDGIYYVSVDVNSCLEFLFSLSACFDFPQQQQQQQPQKREIGKKERRCSISQDGQWDLLLKLVVNVLFVHTHLFVFDWNFNNNFHHRDLFGYFNFFDMCYTVCGKKKWKWKLTVTSDWIDWLRYWFVRVNDLWYAVYSYDDFTHYVRLCDDKNWKLKKNFTKPEKNGVCMRSCVCRVYGHCEKFKLPKNLIVKYCCSHIFVIVCLKQWSWKIKRII